jgi:hypothetical protein
MHLVAVTTTNLLSFTENMDASGPQININDASQYIIYCQRAPKIHGKQDGTYDTPTNVYVEIDIWCA